MARLQPRNQAPGVPQSGRHDSKPEGGRLTANAITGLKPRPASYDVTDPGGAGVQLRVMPSGAKRWYFRFYWRNKRQRLGLGQWPTVGLAEARARARKAREVLDEGIDPRKAGIVKRARGRTESPVAHAPEPASHPLSSEPAAGTAAHAISKIVRRPTDLSDDPDHVPHKPLDSFGQFLIPGRRQHQRDLSPAPVDGVPGCQQHISAGIGRRVTIVSRIAVDRLRALLQVGRFAFGILLRAVDCLGQERPGLAPNGALRRIRGDAELAQILGELGPPSAHRRLSDVEPLALLAHRFDDDMDVRVRLIRMQHHRVSVFESPLIRCEPAHT